MNTKNFILVTLSLILLVSLTVSVSAVGLEVDYIKANGEELELANGTQINHAFERGEDLKLKIKLTALENVEDAVVEADIYGYRYANREDGLSDTTDTFDMDENDTDYQELELTIPTKMDKDYYLLRIRVGDRFGTIADYEYSIHVKGVADEDAVVIKDYSFSPSQIVEAGRAMVANVRVKNIGDEDYDDVKVTVSIPELGVADYETMDELEKDTAETFEELILRVPSDAQPGEYTVRIVVEFDEYEETVVTDIITVKGADVPVAGSLNSVINVPSSMDLTVSGVAFPIYIQNNGNSDAVYSLSASGINWGTYNFDPAADVIVPAGSSKTIYLYINADEVSAGEKFFKLQVVSGEDVNEVALSVNVSEKEASTGLRSALEIGLIVLVVILIIIGLIIGFSKLKGSKDDEESETYY